MRAGHLPLGPRSGQVTVEFVAAILVILLPMLLGLSEVYRVEHRARKLLFSAQRQCIAEAIRLNGVVEGTLEIPMRADVEILPSTRRVFPNWRPKPIRLEKSYFITTGSGRE